MDARPLKILVADDNQSDRMILCAIVKKMGHIVCEAADGNEAIEQFMQQSPDIILLDVIMPNLNGQEAAREIKKLAGEDMVPIIFLTSLQEASDLAACLESGGDDFISKPYNKIILQAKINAFSRMLKMHNTLQQQRDVISENNEHMKHEQQVARAVYDNVAHSGCLDLPNIKYLLSPFSIFNGDVLLAARRPSGSIHILLGDFTGHGLPAAIGAMPLAEIFYGMTAKGFLMADILREINIKLKNILPVGYFCCTCMVNLSFRKQEIEVWMGGLPDYGLYRHQTGEVERVKSNHLPLGVLSTQAFDASTKRYEFLPGDKFYMWSDGIIEARNGEGELFGEARLFSVFEDKKSEDFFDRILSSVNHFCGENGKDDDTTLLELSMVDESVVGKVDIDLSSGAITGPTDWHMVYTLRNETLKTFNPLPVMLNILNDVPALRHLSGQLYTLMAELFSNAFEHGVLGLKSELKDGAEGFAEYYRQRGEAMASLEDAYVTFDFDLTPTQKGGCLSIMVEDSGKGFDYKNIKAEPVNQTNVMYSGRGIPLIHSLCDSLTFLGKGNKVKVSLSWQTQPEE
ncbi:MAG: SpoIIE family protein phosphatase [Gammaproteobacteria bacterium]|nr:SpoIIE family protein phosphatase [Gammaproteobacteria bacterium]